ncbi:MAG: tetratricopeptide repeat protein [Bacteroidetes bacterium]|nr:tetratricopeptide repeat protein [Bacteroidota bacterium]
MRKIILSALLITSTLMSAQTLQDAIKQSNNEQFETAEKTFTTLIQATPNNGEYFFHFGECYFKQENLVAAESMYKKGIAVNATNPLCYVGLGKVQWYAKNETEAKANFFKAQTLAQNKSAVVNMRVAETYINAENKNLVEAMNLLAQAQKMDNKNAEVYLLIGDAYLEQNNGTEAIKNYDKAKEFDKTSAKALLRMGQLYSRAKNYNLALDYYKQATDLEPLYAPAYREKAELYFRAGKYDDAVAQYKEFLKLNNNISAQIRYTGFLYQAKKYKESIAQGVEVLSKDSSNIYLYRYLGFSYFENGDYPNGLARMENFFKKATPETRIIQQDYEYYGKLLAKTGKDSLGVIALLKAAELDTTKKDIYGDLAAAYLKMKKYPEAISAYNKKIAASPKPTANDNFGLGRAYYYSKEYVNADSAFARITRTNPEYPLGYLWRARANTQLDANNEKWLAKPHYETFIIKVKPEETEKSKKDLTEAYTYMAAYYAKQKDLPNTKAQFQKVLELDPNNAQAKKFMSSPEAK